MGKHKKYPVGSYGWEKRAKSRAKTRNGIPEFAIRPFAAVDGEGGTKDGRHHYFLLRAGEHELYNKNDRPLTGIQCMEWLAHLPTDKIYVAFAFGYDVTMMVRDMPMDRLKRLMARDKRTKVVDGKLVTYPVDWKQFQLDYMPGKEFKVRVQENYWPEDDTRGDDPQWTPWVTVHDTFSFFQCSFVSALKRWFGTGNGDDWVGETTMLHDAIIKIAEGKDQRAEFTGLSEYIRQYCHLECNMLVLLMDRFRDNAYEAGIRPARWQGPGNLVEAVMRREGFPKNKDVALWDTNIGRNVREMANASYYGGRFENPVIGNVQGPVYQADINSAYASIYRDLPCLVHGIWHSVGSTQELDSTALSVREYHFSHNARVSLCGLPVRTPSGAIIFPRAGNGIYWSHEVQAAAPYFDGLATGAGYIYEKVCECTPFDWIYRIYDHRLEVGKNSGMGLIDKLVLASTYGKLCQSVGSAPFANPVWASLITSLIRTQLYSASMMVNDGADVLMLATDGIFTLERRDLLYGKELGQWEETVHDSMFCIQSGVYLLPDKMPKSRGVPNKKMGEREDDLRAAWAARGDEPYEAAIMVDLHSFNGIGLSVARGKPNEAGEWVDVKRNLGFEWRNKRNATGWTAVGDSIRTTPIDGHIHDRNIPYKETIGGILLAGVEYPTIERLRDSDQPDWNYHNVGYGIRK